MARYQRWLDESGYGSYSDYQDLWAWSVRDLDRFWESIWKFFNVAADPLYTRVFSDRRMPGARWFEGAKLSFPEHIFRDRRAGPAIKWQSESGPLREIGWDELRDVTGALAMRLKSIGVVPGDRVVAFMPNIPEAVISFLAVTSVGGVWSVASPDFGIESLLERFQQIRPKVLIAVDGYDYGGKHYERSSVVAALQIGLPTLTATILVPGSSSAHSTQGLLDTFWWAEAICEPAPLEFERVAADHPLWIVYTSGTTGLPKALVHGHGGILLERLKAGGLQGDVREDDVYFWYTTTGWVMWNISVSALLNCATLVLYDGSPWFPDRNVLWRLAEEAHVSIFGTSAAYLTACMRDGARPGTMNDLSGVRMIGATASTLSADAARWVYEAVKQDVWLSSSSGGTDVATAFVGGCPLLPVYAGEIQCRALGVDVDAFDEDGNSVVGQVGELVVKQPMPSMPLFFWNDPGGQRYHDSYFSTYPGVWRHGDWLRITTHGGAQITGRSDATINRMGIRVGTSDIYSAIDELPEVADSLVVELSAGENKSAVYLFVVLVDDVSLNESLDARIRATIGLRLTRRHIPDRIVAVPDIPHTLAGKKLEIPVKRILAGAPRDEVVALGSVANPSAFDFFVDMARTL
jgi:acetoacetyl-CoA synthetase